MPPNGLFCGGPRRHLNRRSSRGPSAATKGSVASLSQLRLPPSTGVPESKNFECVFRYPVIHVVPDPRKCDATHALQLRTPCSCTDAGIHGQETEDAVEILAHGAWRERAILGPPCCRLLDLRLRVVGDLDPERGTHPNRRNCSRSRSQETTSPRSA